MLRNIKCIIVDDEPKAIDLLSSRLKILFPDITVLGSYTDWQSAVEAIRKNEFHILFLDVNMPEKTGIDFLKLFPNNTFEVIFITAHSEFALQAIKFSAAGYVLKPIDDYELSFAVNKAIENLSPVSNKHHDTPANTNNYKIGIPNVKGIDYLNADDILYFESVNKYTKVVTKEYSIISSYNLGEFKKIINADIFFQPHRSYIINLHHIKRYETSGSLIMADNMNIPISKNVKTEFQTVFNSITRTAGH
ncbi:MAG: response regulator transcription factor [Bacteroidetes bacterium]|nr:response regulator transcription factor [Bacteroidota bacterium]